MMGSKLLENYKLPEPINSEVVSNGSCEFAGPKLFDGSLGRKYPDGLECFGFSDPNLFCSCPTRKEALRSRARS